MDIDACRCTTPYPISLNFLALIFLMNVLISVDIEGMAGVFHPEQTRAGNGEYEAARRWMTLEANAAIKGHLPVAQRTSGSTIRTVDSATCCRICSMLAPRSCWANPDTWHDGGA